MNRRSFLKWMLAFLAVLAASFAFIPLGKWLRTTLNINGPEGEAEGTEPEIPVRDDGSVLGVFVMSDLHVSQGSEVARHLDFSLKDVKALGTRFDGLILTGDNTDGGSEEDYKELQRILGKYKLPPIHANLGNHDFYDVWLDKEGSWNRENMPNGKTDKMSRERFQKYFRTDKPYHKAELNGITFLMLSQEVYIQEKPEVGEGAWYSDEQMNWLKGQMKQHKNDRPIFVMTHQPLPPKGRDGGTHQLIMAKEFRAILKPYKHVFVFCGHRHQDLEGPAQHYVKETFHYFHNSSLGKVMNTKFEVADKEKAQSLYVQVFKDKVLIRGRAHDKQSWIESAEWAIPIQ
ncbi:phosphohydrolase [Paenibacillus larvae subsp. pulvifaciens]|uniref:Phosphohydrolase n=1 Tax=Paenibacillus larvae subsp. pulvifaciens TaxID=1477 RepID=A0A1V0UQT5_9BACL|nr:metallophosphoesterase [Paenibacillus larvae]ARF67655.1 phosphohydrolase [Paenibacillus larvae subsp. pulvifaciens]